MNLLEETIETLKTFSLKPSDVRCILFEAKKKDHSISWDDFAKVANKEYDNSYGVREVNGTLTIVGDTWWLSRGEYDGSEWWEFNTMPKIVKPETYDGVLKRAIFNSH